MSGGLCFQHALNSWTGFAVKHMINGFNICTRLLLFAGRSCKIEKHWQGVRHEDSQQVGDAEASWGGCRPPVQTFAGQWNGPGPWFWSYLSE